MRQPWMLNTKPRFTIAGSSGDSCGLKKYHNKNEKKTKLFSYPPRIIYFFFLYKERPAS